MREIVVAIVLAVGLLAGGRVHASEDVYYHVHEHAFSFSNPFFGKFDYAQLRRGYQVYKEVCSSCHAMKQLSFRNLIDIGFTEDEVKAIAAEYTVMDGPDDEGEMFEREAVPADDFVSPFPNEKAARASNNGAYPPDLSLMAKARIGGPHYIYALLTGYSEEVPEEFSEWYDESHSKDFELADGMNFNKVFPGNAIAMPPPLSDEAVEYADGAPTTLAQHAEDVTAFLVWAASPELEERRSTGIKVMIFLFALTALLYALKRQIWSDVH